MPRAHPRCPLPSSRIIGQQFSSMSWPKAPPPLALPHCFTDSASLKHDDFKGDCFLDSCMCACRCPVSCDWLGAAAATPDAGRPSVCGQVCGKGGHCAGFVGSVYHVRPHLCVVQVLKSSLLQSHLFPFTYSSGLPETVLISNAQRRCMLLPCTVMCACRSVLFTHCQSMCSTAMQSLVQPSARPLYCARAGLSKQALLPVQEVRCANSRVSARSA